MTRIINGSDGPLALAYADHSHIGEENDGGKLPEINFCQGRLTLTSGTPVTTADVSGATTLYFTPYKGNLISLYDGVSKWNTFTFTEKSITLVGLTASKPYDVFAYDNAGTVTLELLVWTDATHRATALVFQNGIYVKSGATTRRYLGTIYINSSGGQTDDAYATRYVWNYYNRVVREIFKASYSNHTYATSSYRAWNNDTANKVDFVVGILEDGIQTNLTASSEDGIPAVYANLDSISAGHTGGTEVILTYTTSQSAGSSFLYTKSDLSIGYHYIAVAQRQWSGTGTYWYYKLSAMLFG